VGYEALDAGSATEAFPELTSLVHLGSLAEMSLADVAVDDTGTTYLSGQFTGTLQFDAVTLTAASPAGDGFLLAFDGASTAQWGARIGDIGTSGIHHVRAAPGGGVVVQGNIQGGAVFQAPLNTALLSSAGGDDKFLARLSADGRIEWSTRFGSSGDDDFGNGLSLVGTTIFCGGVCITTDCAVGPDTFAGDTRDPVVAIYDLDGTYLSAVRYLGSQEDRLLGLAADQSGRFTLVGLFRGSLDVDGRTFTTTGSAGYLATSNPDGSNLSGLSIDDTSGEDSLEDVVVDEGDRRYVVGYGNGPVNLGAGLEGQAGWFAASYELDSTYRWAYFFPGGFQSDRLIATDRDLVLAGTLSSTITIGATTIEPSGPSDGLVLALDRDSGEPRWHLVLAGSGSASANVIGRAGSELVIAGPFDGELRIGDRVVSVSQPGLYLGRVSPPP